MEKLSECLAVLTVPIRQRNVDQYIASSQAHAKRPTPAMKPPKREVRIHDKPVRSNTCECPKHYVALMNLQVHIVWH